MSLEEIAEKLNQIDEEIARVKRVRPHLRDLGEVFAQDRKVAYLAAQRDALTSGGRS